MKTLQSRWAKVLLIAVPLLYIGAVLYFWNIASDWENRLSEDWARDPLLSNASATLEYVKALVKTVMLSSVVIIVTLCFKRKSSRDTERNSETTKQ